MDRTESDDITIACASETLSEKEENANEITRMFKKACNNAINNILKTTGVVFFISCHVFKALLIGFKKLLLELGNFGEKTIIAKNKKKNAPSVAKTIQLNIL